MSQNRNLSRNKKGFTLIEFLIIIAITGIMTVVTIVSVQGMKKRKELETAGRQVASILRESQNKALTGKIISGTIYPCAFRVVFQNSGSGVNYNLSYAPSTNCTGFVSYESGTMEKVQLSGATATTTTYAVPHASVTGNLSVVIRPIGGGTPYAVCLSASGGVEEQIDGTCP